MVMKFSRIIEAPIDVCFSALLGNVRVRRWLGGELETEFSVLAEESMEGSGFRESYPPFWELTGEVTAFNRPTLISVEFTANVLNTKGNSAHRFKELGPNKTELNLDLEIVDDTVAKRAALQLVKGQIDKFCTAQLETTKQVAESKVAKLSA